MKSTGRIIFLWCFTTISLLAQVNLEIDEGIVVEMTGGVYFEIDGELIQHGSGYFAGQISSGERMGITEFAGLTLSNGLDGTINCYTGESYAMDNGEPNNFKRYYQLINTGGYMPADIEVDFISNEEHDERNGLEPPYYIYAYTSEWNRYGEGSSESPVTASGVEIPVDTLVLLLADFQLVGLDLDQNEIPASFSLKQNYPNPFNPSTTIRYGLPEDVAVSLVIYDMRGNTVKTIDSGSQTAGWYEHTWNGLDETGRPVPTGLYLTRLQAGSYTKTIKMLYLK